MTDRVAPVVWRERDTVLRSAEMHPELPRSGPLVATVQEIAERSAAADLPIRYIGTMPLFEEPRIYPGRERDWWFGPLARDPAYRDPDGWAVPAGVLQLLQQIEGAGVDWSNLYCAHELQKGVLTPAPRVDPEVLLPPPPPRVERTSRALGDTARTLWAAAAAPLGLAAAVGLGLGALAVATGAIAGVGLAALDPILLGVVVARGRPVAVGEQAAWFYLASWTYADEEAPWRS